MSNSEPALGRVAAGAGGVADQLRRAFRYLGTSMVVVGLVVAGMFGYILGSLRPGQLRYASAYRAISRAHEAMINQETGLRGYLLVHDPRFLEPYRQGVSALATEDAAASRYLGTDPSMAPLLLDMRVAEQAWISQWALNVAADKAPSDPVSLATFLDQGKSLFDAYRSREQALSDIVEHKRDVLQTREGLALGIGLALVAVVGAAIVWVMERQRRRLRDMMGAPVDAIVAATERMAKGELDARVELAGPAEFRRIGQSVNVMGDGLVLARDGAQAHKALIERQEHQMRKILSMAREIAGSLSLRYVLRAVATSAVNVSGFPQVTVWLCDPDNTESLSAMFDTDARDGVPGDMAPTEVGVGVVGLAVKYGRTTTEAAGDKPSAEVHSECPMRTLAVALIVGARVSGALEFSSPQPLVLADGSLDVLETLAIHAAAAIEAARLHGQSEYLAKTDGLTGLANRRSLDSDLALECERTARYQRPMALIMFDVDHFKLFNDAFGHQRGDEVLQELAATITRELRATDTAYRYGGEEFAVLARETTAQQAASLAERLRARIQDHFSARGAVAPVTASFGIGLVPPEQPQPHRLIGSADAALYQAKALGRNRVRLAFEPAIRVEQPVP